MFQLEEYVSTFSLPASPENPEFPSSPLLKNQNNVSITSTIVNIIKGLKYSSRDV